MGDHGKSWKRPDGQSRSQSGREREVTLSGSAVSRFLITVLR
jgi:hypothetical protein